MDNTTQCRDNWDASLYSEKQRYQHYYGTELVSRLLAPEAGEAILDLGCGAGDITEKIRESGAVVTGMDYSPRMIEKAKQNYPHIEFLVGDARNLPYESAFDAVFSSAALHWIPDAGAVVKSVAKALKTGGRFVAKFSCRGSLAGVSDVITDTLKKISGNQELKWWLYFPSIGEYTSLLESNGIEPVYASISDDFTPLDDGEEGLANWIRTFIPVMFPDLKPEEIEKAIPEISEKTRPILFREGKWHINYRRIQVAGVKL
ncbi:MAG: class I SAM-dependent methyltransferase [Firmicutes bacterium]|nr:class I SAM-dependent methyltransferase [Bacillota bacterium]